MIRENRKDTLNFLKFSAPTQAIADAVYWFFSQYSYIWLNRFDAPNMSWATAAQTFPLFCRLLEMEDYLYSAILGLVISVGGITESIVS